MVLLASSVWCVKRMINWQRRKRQGRGSDGSRAGSGAANAATTDQQAATAANAGHRSAGAAPAPGEATARCGPFDARPLGAAGQGAAAATAGPMGMDESAGPPGAGDALG